MAAVLCVALVMLAAAFAMVMMMVDQGTEGIAREASPSKERAVPASLAEIQQQKRLGALRRTVRMRKVVCRHGCGSITLPEIELEMIEVPSLAKLIRIEPPAAGGIAR